jgi:hypothetical protein
MSEGPSQGRKPLWTAVGVLATFALLASYRPPWGMWVYCGIGTMVAAYWFWSDRSPTKGERTDIAIALPFMAILWPVLVLALPFMKQFRNRS